MIQIPLQHQSRRDRRPGAQNLQDHEPRIGEVPAENPCGIGDRHRETDEMRKGIGSPRKGDVAPEPHQGEDDGGPRAVAIFPASRDFRRRNLRASAQIHAHHDSPYARDDRGRDRALQDQRFPGFPVGDENRADDKEDSNEEGLPLLEKRIDQRNIDFRWQRFVWLASSESGTHSTLPSTVACV